MNLYCTCVITDNTVFLYVVNHNQLRIFTKYVNGDNSKKLLIQTFFDISITEEELSKKLKIYKLQEDIRYTDETKNEIRKVLTKQIVKHKLQQII
jgi:hypothetical protein